MTRMPIPIRHRWDFICAWIVVSCTTVALVATMARHSSGGEGPGWVTVLTAVVGWHTAHQLWDHYRFERILRQLHEKFPDA
jgi:hypothetical protein